MKVFFKTSFSWKFPSPGRLLVTFLAFFSRHLSVSQASPLTNRCSKDTCHLSLDRIAEIREVVFPISKPWEHEQCVPLVTREREFELAMAGLRKEMALSRTSFGPKHDHLNQMADFIDFLETNKLVVTRPKGFKLDPFLRATISSL